MDMEKNGVWRQLAQLSPAEKDGFDSLYESLLTLSASSPRVALRVAVQLILPVASDLGIPFGELVEFLRDANENYIAPIERAQRDGVS